MKFASAARAVGRAAMLERQRRDRATAPLLRALYPQLASLQLNFDFRDESEFLPSPQVTVFHPPARAYFRFACPYSDCDGEFDLVPVVTSLMDALKPRVDGRMQCAGTRHAGVRCTLSLDYVVAAHRAPEDAGA